MVRSVKRLRKTKKYCKHRPFSRKKICKSHTKKLYKTKTKTKTNSSKIRKNNEIRKHRNIKYHGGSMNNNNNNNNNTNYPGSAGNYAMMMVGDGNTQKHLSFEAAFN